MFDVLTAGERGGGERRVDKQRGDGQGEKKRRQIAFIKFHQHSFQTLISLRYQSRFRVEEWREKQELNCFQVLRSIPSGRLWLGRLSP